MRLETSLLMTMWKVPWTYNPTNISGKNIQTSKQIKQNSSKNLSKGIEQIFLKWYNLIRAEKIDLLWIKLYFSYFILQAQFDGNSICGGNRWKDAAGSPVIGLTLPVTDHYQLPHSNFKVNEFMPLGVLLKY